jgi:hypothetical protein
MPKMEFKPQIPQMEIPEAVRQMAERNVEQSRSAYTQFLEMARRAQEVVAKSSGAMTQSALDIQTKALRFAEQTMDAGFSLASELSRAPSGRCRPTPSRRRSSAACWPKRRRRRSQKAESAFRHLAMRGRRGG